MFTEVILKYTVCCLQGGYSLVFCRLGNINFREDCTRCFCNSFFFLIMTGMDSQVIVKCDKFVSCVPSQSGSYMKVTKQFMLWVHFYQLRTH